LVAGVVVSGCPLIKLINIRSLPNVRRLKWNTNLGR